MTKAQGRGEIRELLARYGVRPKKRLGQHFLADPNLVDKIVRTAGIGDGDRVLEIGVGTGTLTRALAAAGAHVVAYEIDDALRQLLEETLAGLDVKLRFADALALDLGAELANGEWTLVANLPYNVGTPLVIEVLKGVPAVTKLVVMLQREVAERLVAVAGMPAYGLPSVSVGLRANAKLAFTLPPQVFHPQPEVESAVVVIERKSPPALSEPAEALATVAFRQRRKMLRRSLGEVLDDVAATLEAAGVPATTRPEEVSIAGWLEIAGAAEALS